jgi:hypothetical protein
MSDLGGNIFFRSYSPVQLILIGTQSVRKQTTVVGLTENEQIRMREGGCGFVFSAFRMKVRETGEKQSVI